MLGGSIDVLKITHKKTHSCVHDTEKCQRLEDKDDVSEGKISAMGQPLAIEGTACAGTKRTTVRGGGKSSTNQWSSPVEGNPEVLFKTMIRANRISIFL